MIDLIPDRLDRFLAEDEDRPVTMLNLLRFRPDGGRELYYEYLAQAGPVVARHGAEILFTGTGLDPLAAEPGQAWDAVALVRYPSRRAFAEMVTDPDFERANSLRMSALEEAVLQPLVGPG